MPNIFKEGSRIIESMHCMHKSSWEKEWLPRFDNSITVPHPYCEKCGAVKNISHDRAKKLGYYENTLHMIKKYLEKRGGKLAEAQIRLITKELQKFEDIYWMRGSTQRNAFISALMKYANLSPRFVESFL